MPKPGTDHVNSQHGWLKKKITMEALRWDLEEKKTISKGSMWDTLKNLSEDGQNVENMPVSCPLCAKATVWRSFMSFCYIRLLFRYQNIYLFQNLVDFPGSKRSGHIFID